MKLVIAEKPSVGAAIAAALGVTGKKDGYIENNGYIISWCVGHLVGLAEAAAYGEQYKSGTMTAYLFCRRIGNIRLPQTRENNSKSLKGLCTGQMLRRLSMLATQDARAS